MYKLKETERQFNNLTWEQVELKKADAIIKSCKILKTDLVDENNCTGMTLLLQDNKNKCFILDLDGSEETFRINMAAISQELKESLLHYPS